MDAKMEILPVPCTLPDLPDEIIVLVMGYLSLADRKNCRLVCKKWLELSYASSLTKDDVTVIPKFFKLQKLNFGRKYRNLRIQNFSHVAAPSKALKFWERCGQHVVSLECYLVDVYDSKWRHVFPNTPNLEYLWMSEGDINDENCFPMLQEREKIVPYPAPTDHLIFPKLLSLDLLHFSYYSLFAFEDKLNSFVKNAPLLKRLNVEYYGRHIRRFDLAPWTFLNCFNGHLGNNIKELNISHTCIDDEVLINILSMIGPQLVGLYLRGCKYLTDECVEIIKARFPNLKQIDLTDTQISDSGLHLLIESLSHLTHISLAKSKARDSISLLKNAKQIVAMEFSYSKAITSSTLRNMCSGSVVFEKFVDLRLDGLLVASFHLNAILHRLPMLTYLYLNDCIRLSDNALEIICEKAKKLRALSIANWGRLTDVSSLVNIKGLIHLDLYGCKKISHTSLETLKFLELQTLDLSRTTITALGCKIVVGQCPSLQDMYLDIELENDLMHVVNQRNKNFKWHFGLGRFKAESIFDN